jgi:hypothetical protein
MALHSMPATTNMPIATTKFAVCRSQLIPNRLKYLSPEDDSSRLPRNFGVYQPKRRHIPEHLESSETPT